MLHATRSVRIAALAGGTFACLAARTFGAHAADTVPDAPTLRGLVLGPRETLELAVRHHPDLQGTQQRQLKFICHGISLSTKSRRVYQDGTRICVLSGSPAKSCAAWGPARLIRPNQQQPVAVVASDG